MAFKNKEIKNTITGQDIRFLQTGKETGGQLLEMETTYNSFSKEPPAHYHPNQVEDFTVLTGELTIRLNGQLKILKPGDSLHIPKNVVHAMWNNTQSKTVVNWQIRPALNSDHLLEMVTGLANDGKTNKNGMPHIFQIALLMHKFDHVFRLTKPPYMVQKILFLLLTPLAYLFGFRPTYKKYLD